MSLLKKAMNEQAFLKAGIFGFQGAGKTYTATLIALGLHKYIKSEKPVAFVDTETGSSYVLPKFMEAGVELHTAKTRAFKDLLDVMDEAEKTCDIIIIDSITHVWREFISSYKRRNNRKFIKIQDWGPLKEEWQRFTDKYINSKLHIIMCGRAGNVFEDVADEENGENKTWKAVKVGTKMSAETETGYEPSLLLEMVKVFNEDEKSGKYVRRCHVIKDRFAVIDSKEFDNPQFKDFVPHVSLLNLGGEQVGVDTSRTSDELFGDNGETMGRKIQRRREIAIEELQAVLIKAGMDGTSAEAKKGRVHALESVFGTSSKTAIENLHPDRLEAGVARLKVEYLGEEEVEGGNGSKEIQQDIAI